jgi:hypothetical protein
VIGRVGLRLARGGAWAGSSRGGRVGILEDQDGISRSDAETQGIRASWRRLRCGVSLARWECWMDQASSHIVFRCLSRAPRRAVMTVALRRCPNSVTPACLAASISSSSFEGLVVGDGRSRHGKRGMHPKCGCSYGSWYQPCPCRSRSPPPQVLHSL